MSNERRKEISLKQEFDASFAVHVEVCDNEHKRDGRSDSILYKILITSSRVNTFEVFSEPAGKAREVAIVLPGFSHLVHDANNAELNAAACDPLLFVRALATGVPLTHPDAGICTDNMHSQSEALLLRTCEASSPSTWTQGVNVMQNCAQIPKYTPVATFLFGQYVSDGTVLSGVFLKCTATGFENNVRQVFETNFIENL
uniref:Uncharacterized protein n=1 Tax=Magallana gigas TaxID=29159 RepID=K1QFW1_MAGGI